MKSEKVLVILAVAAIAASCQPKEEFGSLSTVPVGDVTITATFEQPDDGTKTTMNSTGKVLWSAGDEVALMTPTTKDKFTLTSGDKSASAEFAGTITGEAPYYLLYPYSDGCAIADGKLKFSLPQVQTISKAGTFAQGASPALAFMSDYSVPAQFKNLCGVLELSLCGSGVKFTKLELFDLNGDQLWGDCEVALDGTQGTDEQKMTITGGSNKLILDFGKPVSLKAASATLYDIVVPAGTMSKGFTVKAFDSTGTAICFITTQNTAAKVGRSKVSVMKKYKLTDDYKETNVVASRGYYKELFVDRGKGLSGQNNPPAADSLGWQHDYMSTSDSVFQNKYMAGVGNSEDNNGLLLYPDDEPRYRMIYVNGGKSVLHGRSLKKQGREILLRFVENGGSYVGTCAGAFLSASNSAGEKTEGNLGIYPLKVTGMDYFDTCSNVLIPETSPLLKYYDFGGDLEIDSVYFNGGCYMPDASLLPETEILGRYYMVANAKDSISEYWKNFGGWWTTYNNKISAWAYKPTDVRGRMVCTGSHPEGVATGERLHMMMAMCQYATDGNGCITEKCVLENGVEYKFDQQSALTNPAFAPVGDQQYHHFKLNVPAGGLKNLQIKLASESGKYLTLALRNGDWAWRSDADYLLAQTGSNKTLSIANLPEGIWYVSVCCPEVIKTTCASSSITFNGDKSLLNGVPYSITATWE